MSPICDINYTTSVSVITPLLPGQQKGHIVYYYAKSTKTIHTGYQLDSLRGVLRLLVLKPTRTVASGSSDYSSLVGLFGESCGFHGN